MGQRYYQRFAVLARSRTGSNLLVSLLDSHPAVVAHYEVFRTLGERSCNQIFNRVFCRYPPGIKAVGFKIFYYHPNDDDSGEIWRLLRADPALKILHLKRRNVLRTIVSRSIAASTEAWVQTGKDPTFDRRVDLCPEQVRKDLELTRRWETEYEEMFRTNGNPVLTLSYEELAEDMSSVFTQVCKFLAIPPQVPTTRFQRQNPEGLHELIRNYSEVRESLAGTCWEELFDE